jgi:phenylacetate-CoA ligase
LPKLEMLLRPAYWRTVARWESFIETSERWSPDRLAAHQLQELQSLVQHAYDNVPYYTRLFDAAAIEPRDIKALEDVRHIPTIGKRDLQEHLTELLATNIPARRRKYSTSGGSTGIPVGFYHDRRATSAKGSAFMIAQWRRVGYEPGDRSAILRGTVVSNGDLTEVLPFRNALLMSSYHLTDDLMPTYLERLRAFRPKYIQAYPSSITLLARYMLEHDEKPLLGLRAVLCGSENIYDGQRHQIEQAFQSRVFSWYGQSEVVCLAGECEHDGRLHIFPQYGITELLDTDNKPITQPGTVGEIVGTGFLSRAMPLIRYRTMDMASYAPGTCEMCHRPYKLLERIEGRLQEFIVTSTGRYISMTAINMHSPVFDNVRQFRFYQDTPGSVTLRVVPKSTYNPLADKDQIGKELAVKLGNDVSLSIEVVDEISRGPRGKYRFLEQKLPLTFGD